MKRLLPIIVALLIATPAWAVEPINLARGLGVVGMGAGVAAAGSCEAATDYVGTKDVSGSTISVNAAVSQCFLFTASCSGTLTNGYIRHTSTSAYSAKVCVYSYDTDAPDVGDEKLGCSGNITGTTANNWDTAAMSGGTVVKDSTYWVCLFIDDDSANALDIDRDASSITYYYHSAADDYDSEPATLDGTWSASAGSANRSIYVSIGP